MKLRLFVLSVTVAAALSFSACGGGGMGSHTDPTTYTIAGTISGLTGAGLVLQNNAGDNLAVSANQTSFIFSTPIPSGSNYDVTVSTQPSGETCTVTNGSGTADANVTNVAVSCSASGLPTYTIGGTITGLTAAGLVLQDNAGDNLAISANQTAFTFATAIPSGSSYNATVFTQPAGETCTITNGSGTADANVTNIAVSCSASVVPTYTIGGTITGLTGTGLVLQDNAADNLAISANQTAFTFATPIPSGSTYNVTVLTQPTNPTQTCAVTNGSGTANGNVTNVAVTCSSTLYTVSVAVSGLTGTLVVQDNPGNTMTETTNGTFAFSPQIPSGGSYAVSVVTQPSGETCAVGSNASGTITGNVTVAVTCSATLYTVSVAISGLTGTVVVQDNPGNTMTETTNGTFAFSPQIPSGGSYAVSVVTQPSGETCAVGSNGSGTITGNVTVTVTCSATLYTVSVAISGLTGTVVVQDNPGNTMTETTNGTFAFSPQIPSGGSYAVSVVTQPSGETCAVGSNASGTLTGNVTVTVTCSATLYTVSVAISGLTGTVVMQDNPGNTMTETTNGTFAFSPQIPSGGSYAVSVVTQPSGETCTVGSNGSGTITGNVTVTVTCSATLYTVSVAISGLTGTVVVQDNPGNTMTETTNGTFAFSPQIPSGGSYAVSVVTQPSGETCTVGSNGSGTITGNVTVAVTCSATGSTFTIGGTVAGLSGSGLVLQDNGGNNLAITSGQTTFTFSTPIPSGGTYSVTVFTQPTGPTQTCTVTDGSGTANANVTNILVVCNNQWTWQNGANDTGTAGDYVDKKNFSSGFPGARYGAVTWTDNSGNLWLFGGNGFGASPAIESYLNDLWEWNGTEWAWMSGSNNTDQIGVYGTKGSINGTNIPGARLGAVGWKDSSGNLWLFGGYGFDSVVTDNPGPLNDLWEYSPTSKEWTYQGGSELINAEGVYGSKGSTNSTNFPGSRYYATASTDASGNFWLFGGEAFDKVGNQGYINDLWELNTTTLQWTYVSGANTVNQSPHYGTIGSGSALNVPGARQGLVSWIDSSQNFWLFGGLGIDSKGNYGDLNDLWEYSPSTSEWVWQGPSNSNIVNQAGNYVAIGQTGTPGGRTWPSGWLDTSGNFWLFGGQESGDGDGLNDLWLYSAGNWTWESGSSSPNQLGVYGTEGTASPLNAPGARWNAASWLDKNNNLWLFGGSGFATANPPGVLNDLWEFQP